MVLDEDALEAMLARGTRAERDATPAEMVTTDASDDFEVYERAPAAGEPDPPEPEPEPVQDDLFEEFPPRRSVEAPMQAPVEPAPAPRRPEVWPPIRSHAPRPERVAPVAHAPEPVQARPESSASAGGARLAIVQATFNAELTDMMAELAKQKAAKLGAQVVAYTTVPGVYDMPLAAKRLLARDDVDALVVLGVVVKGETSHDELITHATAKTLQELSLQFDKPIGLGITGPGMTWKQAEARVANAAHAVEAAVTLVQIRG